VVVAFVVNLVLGQVHAGFAAQPVSHSNFLWNFLGMVLAGLAFALAGGCPGRQLFLSGEGDGDAAVFVLGMIVGAAFAHNFALAGVPDKIVEGTLVVGGPGPYGQAAVLLGIGVCLVIGFAMRDRRA
jgi:YedE family putative selenium metabolism protein